MGFPNTCISKDCIAGASIFPNLKMTLLLYQCEYTVLKYDYKNYKLYLNLTNYYSKACMCVCVYVCDS